MSTPKEETVYAVISGEVRLYLPGPDGRELEEDRQRAGKVFLLGTVSQDEEDDIQAKAAKDTTLLAMSSAEFLSVTPLSPSRINWLMKMHRQRYAESQRCLREHAFFCLKERLAHKLAELAVENSGLGTIPGQHLETIVKETREGLSAMLGTRPGEVSRVLSCLKEEDLVACEMYGRRIKLLDLEALKNYGRGRRRGSGKRQPLGNEEGCASQGRSGVRRRV